MWMFGTFNSVDENRMNVSEEDSEGDIDLLLNMREEDMDLLLLQRIEPFVFCQYCEQYPADLKCYDCNRTNYCCMECADCDSQNHAEECVRLQMSRSDLFCQG